VKPDAEDQAFVYCLTNVNTEEDEPPTKLARLQLTHLPLYNDDASQHCTGLLSRPVHITSYSRSTLTTAVSRIVCQIFYYPDQYRHFFHS